MENKEMKFAADINWQEVDHVFKDGKLIVVPVGAGCKEHGLHLPNKADHVQVDFFAQKLAEQCDILVMPTVTYGHYPAFVHYAGSVSLSAALCTQMFVEMCEGWHKQGARAFYFLNYGVSTNVPLKAAQEILKTKNIEMSFTDLRSFGKTLEELPDGERPEQPCGTHADEVETSKMLAIDPSLVNMQLAEKSCDNRPGPLHPFKPSEGIRGSYSPKGVFGDPTLATPEKGAIYIQKFIEYLLHDIAPLLQPQQSHANTY